MIKPKVLNNVSVCLCVCGEGSVILVVSYFSTCLQFLVGQPLSLSAKSTSYLTALIAVCENVCELHKKSLYLVQNIKLK